MVIYQGTQQIKTGNKRMQLYYTSFADPEGRSSKAVQQDLIDNWC